VSDPRVTTIIPTYNRAARVLEAIRSVLAQSYTDHEVVVVDDGSTDDTEAAIRREFGERVRYVYKQNGGVSAARNHGIEHAKGELIAFLDSDDQWMPDKLARQIDFLDRHPSYGMVLTELLVVMSDGRETVGRRRASLPVNGWILSDVLRDPRLAPSSVLVRRAVLDAVGGFDPGLVTAEDLDMHLRIALEYPIGLIDEPLVRYSLDGDDKLSNSTRDFVDYVAVIERFVGQNRDRIEAQDRHAAVFKAYRVAAPEMFRHGDYLQGARFYFAALRSVRSLDQAASAIGLTWHAARVLGTRARRRIFETATHYPLFPPIG
jgi:glycosyltransferase involved in cell wall biosynthesis